MALERTILSNLLYNESYTRKVLPFLQDEYFKDTSDQIAFKLINAHITKYNTLPSKREIQIELEKQQLKENIFDPAKECIDRLSKDSLIENEQWLLDTTEEFCKDKALYNALLKAIEIADDKSGKLSSGSIPQILTDALGVSFDTHVGHDWEDDAEERYDTLHSVQKRIPLHLSYLNKITKGGLKPKTLNCLIASTGVGKSLIMCDMAAAMMEQGYNVLYITMEMAEEEIGNRIDANICNIPLDDLDKISKDDFKKRVKKAMEKVKGKLKIKEYGDGAANVSHFRYLVNELKLKKKFVPDVIFVDYLNICASARLKRANVNSYDYVKSIAEELRGWAKELKLPIVTATQTNRDGADNSDIAMGNVSESYGLPMTLDLFLAVMQPPEFAELGQFLFKQLKNRYADINIYNKFVIGVDKSKMRLFDVEESAQDGILDGPVMDNTPSFQKPKKNFGDFT